MPRLFSQGWRFALVGAAGTGVHVAVASALIELAGLPAGAANGIAVVVIVVPVFAFFSHRMWTYRAS